MQLISSFLLLALFGSSLATSSDSLAAKSANGSSASAKSSIGGKKAESVKAAAPIEEQNKARTLGLLNSLHQSHFPVYGALPYVQPVAVPSYAAHYESIPYVQSHSQSAYPLSLPVTSVSSIATPVASYAPVAPVVSQTSYTKPVVSYNQQVVQKPTYTISEQVVHNPVITEVKEIVRRPVIAEVQQVIHKPYLTEYQQVYKLPTFTQHVLKKPSFSSLHQEIIQPPIHLNSEQYHVVAKPTSQILHLPPQYVQPYTTEVVQIPVVHHQGETQTTIHAPHIATLPTIHATPSVPAVSYYPSVAYGGSSGFGSGYGLGGYGSYGTGYGLGGYGSYGTGYGLGGYGTGYGLGGYGSYGTGYGLGGYGTGYGLGGYGSYGTGYGLGGYGYDQHEYGYLTPATCRSGECELKRDNQGREILVRARSTNSNNHEYVPMTYSRADTVGTVPSPVVSSPQIYWTNLLPLFENHSQQMPANNQQPSQVPRSQDDVDWQPYSGLFAADPSPSSAPNENKPNDTLDPVVEKMADEFMKDDEFKNVMSKLYSLFTQSVDQEKNKKESGEKPYTDETNTKNSDVNADSKTTASGSDDKKPNSKVEVSSS